MRKQADEIICEVIKSERFKAVVKKVKPEDLQQDLVSEISLILLEKDPCEIVKLHDKNELIFYTVKILTNLAFSNTSQFYKKFRMPVEELSDNLFEVKEELSQEEMSDLYKKALIELDKIHWYYSKMIKLYVEYGGYRNMARELDIPYSTCFKHVQKGIKLIKQNLYAKR